MPLRISLPVPANTRLALWLTQNGEGGFSPDYDFGNGREHVWLTRCDLIVDITGDQFGWPPVIVTRNSPWHPGADSSTLPGPNWPYRMAEECQHLWKKPFRSSDSPGESSLRKKQCKFAPFPERCAGSLEQRENFVMQNCHAVVCMNTHNRLDYPRFGVYKYTS
jgi:hypothetical protein